MIYFRLPYSDCILTADGQSEECAVSFVSFEGTDQVNFYGNITEVSETDMLSDSRFSSGLLPLRKFSPETREEYIEKTAGVIDFVKKEQLPKLVVSRRKMVTFNGRKLSLGQTFLNLCRAYPNALVYVFLKDGYCWLGAFSEVLADFDKMTGDFRTMSLAGTLPLKESWSSKEIAEQQYVTDYIDSVLKQHADQVKQSETYSHNSGNIKHLRTDFSAKVNYEKVEDLISALHPTPAVCGIPVEFCRNAIRRFEKLPRELYSGYIRIETPERIQCFVNLRCAQILSRAAFIFVGGGITAASDPQKEWEETELKADAVLRNLAFSEESLMTEPHQKTEQHNGQNNQ